MNVVRKCVQYLDVQTMSLDTLAPVIEAPSQAMQAYTNNQKQNIELLLYDGLQIVKF